MKSPLTLNYAAFDDALKLALSGKEPGAEVVLTIRAKVTANSDESADLELEEVTLDKEASQADKEEDAAEGETADTEEEDAGESEDMPAMVVAIAKKKK
jgi:hypothetical protein